MSERYLYEKESIEGERSVLEVKLERSNIPKLEHKVMLLEEESREMKSDFYIKINSFVEEISVLKSKLQCKSLIILNTIYRV